MRLQGVRILLVDDDEDTLEVEQMLLASEGADVRVARSVGQALAALPDFVVDVVVTDVAMPEADGFELLRQLRLVAGETGRVPAIVLTASVDESVRAHAKAAGFATFVTKSGDLGELVRQIVKVVETVRQASDES